MSLTFIKAFSVILLVIFLLMLLLGSIALIRTILFKNPKIKVLEKHSLSGEKVDEYQRSISYLLTTPLEEAIKNLYSRVCEKGVLVKLKNSIIYIYRNNRIESTSILIDAPIKSFSKNEITFNNQAINGDNTYNSKSNLFCVFEALDNIISQDGSLDFNIAIAIYEEDKTNNEVADYFYERKQEFDLVLASGGKILDPITTGLKSYHAYVGRGVNEKITIKYHTKKIGKGEQRINDFIKYLKDNDLFSLKLDKEAFVSIYNVAKDMPYGSRFVLNNVGWLPKLSKRILEEEMPELNKAWKTWFKIGDVQEEEDSFNVEIEFYLSSIEKEEDIIGVMSKLVTRYSLEYEILSKDEKSKRINLYNNFYRKVNSVIENVYQELYITPYIVNEDVSDRNVSKIGQNIIRFSPIYYSLDNRISQKAGIYNVSLTSIDKGISFYEELFLAFRR